MGRILLAPVDRAVRLVAQDFLHDAVDARERLRRAENSSGGADEAPDADALHDFRVASRRLRSWLRAFRGGLRDETSGRVRRTLGRLADLTNASRDTEVALLWLRPRVLRLPAMRRAAANALVARLEERLAAGGADVARAAKGFDTLRARLERELESYRPTVAVDAPTPEATLAEVAARLVNERATTLEAHLSRVSSRADQAEAHAGRLAAKRLRYLLEPLREELPRARRVVDELKLLQDALGDLHDAHVLAAEIREGDEPPLPRVGSPALRAMLETRESRAFARVQREWLGGRAAQSCRSARAVAKALGDKAREGVEIERKFLLRRVPPEALCAPHVTIDQGYLPGRKVAERIRRVRHDGGIDYVRSMKAGAGMVRMEVEEKTTKTVFDGLWRLTGSMRLRKRRYAVPAGELTWEIDEFLDRELVLGEIELPSEGTPVEIPSWLEPHVVREVTNERRFENHQIALRPGKARRRQRAR